MIELSTFSIVGFDPKAKEWGVAVQSKFLAAGAVVSWARAGAGAVATQSYANTSFGPEGLELMERGATAEEALEKLIAGDDGRARRQVGLVDAAGRPATYTGDGCHAWAGGVVGAHYAAQGNILVSGATVDAMARAFEQSAGELADRLVVALAAGQSAGATGGGSSRPPYWLSARRVGTGVGPIATWICGWMTTRRRSKGSRRW